MMNRPMNRLRSYRGSRLFYRKFLEKNRDMTKNNSYPRMILGLVAQEFPEEFPEDSEIGERLKYINSLPISEQLGTEIDKVNKMIVDEIPILYRILHQIDHKLYRSGIIDYETHIFERFVV